MVFLKEYFEEGNKVSSTQAHGPYMDLVKAQATCRAASMLAPLGQLAVACILAAWDVFLQVMQSAAASLLQLLALCCFAYCLQVYLITELVTGGELLDAVLQRGTYSEQEARSCFIQLLRGISYLHSK